MNTLAHLGFEISPAPLDRLVSSLDKIGPAAERAEGSTTSFTSTVNKTGTDLSRATKEALAYEAALKKASTTPLKAMTSQAFSDTQIKAAATGVKQYGTEIDSLRAKFNPLYAASKKYETALNEIAQAEKQGALTSELASAARQRANLALAEGTSHLGGYGKSARASAAHTANLAAQFNDIGVMLAAGQSPLQLALQQGTQINQVFAQLGGGTSVLRALGAGILSMINPLSLATIGIIAFGAAGFQWLMSLREEAQDLDDTLDDLGDAVDRVTSASENSRKSHEDVIRLYGERTDAVMDLIEAQRQQATFDAQNAASGLLTLSEYGDVGNTQQFTNRRTGIEYSGLSIGAQALQNELRIADNAARRLNEAFSDGQAARGLEEQLAAVRSIRTILSEGRDETGRWVTEAEGLYKQFLEAEDALQKAVAAAADGEGAADTFAEGVSRVTDEASDLADEIQRAVDAAASFASDGSLSRLRAELANQYRDDPVGLAAATAGVEFDRKTDISGLDPILQGQLGVGIQANRDQYVADSTAEAQQKLELDNYRRAQREGAKAGKSGESDAEKRQKDLDRVLESLQTEIVLVGKSATARKAANLARRAGVELTSIEGRGITEQVILLDRMNEAWDRSQEAIKRVAEEQDTSTDFFKDTISDAINDFNNLEDVAKRALGNIADALLDSALTDIGTSFAQTAVGGWLGSILANANGNAFQGGNVIPFASGGVVSGPSFFPMSGGKTGLAGEAGPEAIMPLSRGRDGKLGVKSAGGANTINATITVNGESTREQKEASVRQMIALIDEHAPNAVRTYSARFE